VFFKFLLMGVPRQTRKYISGSTMTKTLKNTGVPSSLPHAKQLDFKHASQ